MIPITTSPIPPSPMLHVRSLNKLWSPRFGRPDQWKYKGGFMLMVLTRKVTLQCVSCHESNIQIDSLCGFSPEMFSGYLCSNCIKLPEDYTVFEVTIKLKRRSPLHPTGFKTQMVVCRFGSFIRWMNKVVKAYPGSTATMKYDNLYENAQGDLNKSNRLSYTLKKLWKFLPERRF